MRTKIVAIGSKIMLRSYTPLSLLIIAATSFAICYAAGQRGFYALDQSIVFDGAYRILQGEVPYRDFLFPFGPMPLWVQALFFLMLGTSFKAYLLASSLCNVAASILAALIVQKVGGVRLPALAAGLVTAFWFYSPFGTPYMEQTGFLFSLLGIYLAVITPRSEVLRDQFPYLFGAGCAVGLAALCKQHVGVFSAFLISGVIILGSLSIRASLTRLGAFLLGLGALALLFAVWLFSFSSPLDFYTHTIVIPSSLARSRISSDFGPYGNRWGLLAFLTSGPTREPFQQLLPSIVRVTHILSLTLGALMLALGFALNRNDSKAGGAFRILGAFLTLIPFHHLAFIHFSLNESENGVPFVGLLSGFMLISLSEIRKVASLKSKDAELSISYLSYGAVILLSLALGYEGGKSSLNRIVQEGEQRASFSEVSKASGFSPLRLNKTSSNPRGVLLKGELEGLVEYLSSKNENFFSFPDLTVLYGALKKPSPQPLLWFHSGLTYDPKFAKSISERVVDELKASNVRIIVLDRNPPFRTLDSLLNELLPLKVYIETEFRSAKEIGRFHILEK